MTSQWCDHSLHAWMYSAIHTRCDTLVTVGLLIGVYRHFEHKNAISCNGKSKSLLKILISDNK